MRGRCWISRVIPWVCGIANSYPASPAKQWFSRPHRGRPSSRRHQGENCRSATHVGVAARSASRSTSQLASRPRPVDRSSESRSMPGSTCSDRVRVYSNRPAATVIAGNGRGLPRLDPLTDLRVVGLGKQLNADLGVRHRFAATTDLATQKEIACAWPGCDQPGESGAPDECVEVLAWGLGLVVTQPARLDSAARQHSTATERRHPGSRGEGDHADTIFVSGIGICCLFIGAWADAWLTPTRGEVSQVGAPSDSVRLSVRSGGLGGQPSAKGLDLATLAGRTRGEPAAQSSAGAFTHREIPTPAVHSLWPEPVSIGAEMVSPRGRASSRTLAVRAAGVPGDVHQGLDPTIR